MKYTHPEVARLGRAVELVQSCMDKPSCNYLDCILPFIIQWSTGAAYQADE